MSWQLGGTVLPWELAAAVVQERLYIDTAARLLLQLLQAPTFSRYVFRTQDKDLVNCIDCIAGPLTNVVQQIGALHSSLPQTDYISQANCECFDPSFSILHP